MAADAPLHLERVFLKDRGHIVYLPVAGRTSDAFGNVNRVIEVSKIRQIVDAHPLQRLARLKAGAHRFEVRTVGPNLFMTIHADGG